jgi:hypothetical protein
MSKFIRRDQKKKRPLHINKGNATSRGTASVNIYIPNVGEPSFIK